MDSYYTSKLSKNNHTEKCWIYSINENNIQDRIIQFYYQLVRLKQSCFKHIYHHKIDSNIILLEYKLNDILFYLKKNADNDKTLFHITLMYKLLAYTRDIHEGKGERMLTYMQIYSWYKYFPDLARYMIIRLVYYIDDFDFEDYTFGMQNLLSKDEYSTKYSFGCWRDMKELCNYCIDKEYPKMKGINIRKKICSFVSQLLCNQLYIDYENMKKHKQVSYLAKWFPRENKKNKQLYRFILETLNPYLLTQPYCATNYNREASKIRKMVSSLNKYLNTTEILMCSKQWNSIQLNKLPLSCLYKYKDVLFKKNINLSDTTQEKHKVSHIPRCILQNKNHIELHRLVKDAITYKDNEQICNFIEKIWSSIKKETREKYYKLSFLPILDASYSMIVDNNVPFYSGIAIAIFISELNNNFKNRILTFSNSFDWVNLSSCGVSFVKKVNHIINNITMGCHSDFYPSFTHIIRTLSHTETISKQPTFVILSDMEVNTYKKPSVSTMYDNMNTIILENKLMIKPNIVFWNLRNTNGFPCETSKLDVVMLSGYNISNLYTLIKKDNLIYLKNPYSYLIELLNKRRYRSIEKRVIMYTIQ